MLQRGAFYHPHDCVDEYLYTKDGGVQLSSGGFDEDEIEVDLN